MLYGKCLVNPLILAKSTPLNPWPADNFSKYKTRDILNKVCIVVIHNLILNCMFRIELIHLQQ